MLIVVLALEILYYSLFMKLSKRNISFAGLVITFTLCTIEMYLLNSNQLISYLLFFVLALLGMKFIANGRVLNYDVLVLIIMCLFKLIVEFVFTALIMLAINNLFIATGVSSIVKIGLIVIFKSKLASMYDKLLIKWNNNNFYIRYFTSAIIMIYIIITCLLLILQLI